jgi:hypothetical protein
MALLFLSTPGTARAESTQEPIPDANVEKKTDDDKPTVERDSHYLRYTTELAMVIGAGTAWYWLDRERQIPDWDYPTWKQKATFDVMIFDNNPFRVNYIWHTWAGGASHLLGRSNGLGIGPSIGLSFLSSVVWEYGIEAREQISINDLLITNTTGFALGELAWRFGQYMHSKPDGWGWDIGRYTVGLPQWAHDRIDGVDSVLADPTIYGDLKFSYGYSMTNALQPDGVGGNMDSQSLQHHSIGMDVKLAVFDGYHRPGLREAWLTRANFSDFGIKFTEGGGSATDIYLDTIAFGWRRQNLPEEGSDALGTGFNIGTSVGYKYHREQFENWQDRLGGLHWPGLALDGELMGQGWQLTGALRSSMDFMGVSSLSNKAWHSEYEFPGFDEMGKRYNPITEPNQEIGKQILRDQGYWIGWGPSVRMKSALEATHFGVGGSLFLGKYYSHEGRDRRQDQISIDQNGEKTISDYELWVRANIGDTAYLRLRGTYHKRRDKLEQFSNHSRMSRLALELGADL